MRQYLFGIVYLLFHFQATKVQYCIACTLKFTNNCTFYLRNRSKEHKVYVKLSITAYNYAIFKIK